MTAQMRIPDCSVSVSADSVVHMGRNFPTVVTLAVAAVASLAGLLLGGPRTGYLPGIVISTIIVMAITWRYNPSQFARWSAAMLLAAYHIGATVTVGSDVLSHVSVGSSLLRYDRGLHVFGAAMVILLVAEGGNRPLRLGYWSIFGLGLAAGFAVESLEVLAALVTPRVFSYDFYDSLLDVGANIVGAISAITALVWIHRIPVTGRHSPAT
jgi:hypothetical protein